MIHFPERLVEMGHDKLDELVSRKLIKADSELADLPTETLLAEALRVRRKRPTRALKAAEARAMRELAKVVVKYEQSEVSKLVPYR